MAFSINKKFISTNPLTTQELNDLVDGFKKINSRIEDTVLWHGGGENITVK